MESTGLATGNSGLATGGVAPVWAELDGNHQLQARYLSKDALDAVFARWAAGSAGGVTWNLPDRLGSVRAVMNNSGQLVNTLSYDAFGVSSAMAAGVTVNSEVTSPGVGDCFRYGGYPYDAATGLYYVGARWYDPSQGRWLSRDPLGSEAGDVNWYRYVGNSPVNLTDPTGQGVCDEDAHRMMVRDDWYRRWEHPSPEGDVYIMARPPQSMPLPLFCCPIGYSPFICSPTCHAVVVIRYPNSVWTFSFDGTWTVNYNYDLFWVSVLDWNFFSHRQPQVTGDDVRAVFPDVQRRTEARGYNLFTNNCFQAADELIREAQRRYAARHFQRHN